MLELFGNFLSSFHFYSLHGWPLMSEDCPRSLLAKRIGTQVQEIKMAPLSLNKIADSVIANSIICWFNKYLHKWSSWTFGHSFFIRFLTPSSPRPQSYICSRIRLAKLPFESASAPFGPKWFTDKLSFFKLSQFLLTKCSNPFAVMWLNVSQSVYSFGRPQSVMATRASSPKSFWESE